MPTPSKKPQDSNRLRLETQIHRRKNAKAFSPLLSEWDRTDQDAPMHLRMDESLMASKPIPSAPK